MLKERDGGHKTSSYKTIAMIILVKCLCFLALAHAQAMHEYRWGEMSTEVVVDRRLWTEIVDRRRK